MTVSFYSGTDMTDFRLGWVTDPHLNFLDLISLKTFTDKINAEKLDALVVTGDIAEGDNITPYLRCLRADLMCPVFFILGNHDYYRSNVKTVREAMNLNFTYNEADVGKVKGMFWLQATNNINNGIVRLTDNAALVGSDGWYDGRYADWFKSELIMADYHIIGDFYAKTQLEQFNRMGELAIESANHAQMILTKAFETYNHVFYATHVPCWPENSLYQGRISNSMWLPCFSNKYLGDALLDIMSKQPTGKSLTVLQGHSHHRARFHPRGNIVSLTGEAEYAFPDIEKVFVL